MKNKMTRNDNKNKTYEMVNTISEQSSDVLNYTFEKVEKIQERKNMINHTIVVLIQSLELLSKIHHKHATEENHNEFLNFIEGIFKETFPGRN